jgi:hypothetical protein
MPDDLLHGGTVVQQYDNVGRHVIGGYHKHAGVVGNARCALKNQY